VLIGAARSTENPSIGLHVLEADLRDSDAVQTIARMVTRDLGTPDCLVNCEDPRGRWQLLSDMQPCELHETLLTPLLSASNVASAFTPRMAECGGSTYLQVLGAPGLAPFGGATAHVAAHAGLHGLARALRERFSAQLDVRELVLPWADAGSGEGVGGGQRRPGLAASMLCTSRARSVRATAETVAAAVATRRELTVEGGALSAILVCHPPQKRAWPVALRAVVLPDSPRAT